MPFPKLSGSRKTSSTPKLLETANPKVHRNSYKSIGIRVLSTKTTRYSRSMITQRQQKALSMCRCCRVSCRSATLVRGVGRNTRIWWIRIPREPVADLVAPLPQSPEAVREASMANSPKGVLTAGDHTLKEVLFKHLSVWRWAANLHS